MEFWVGIVFSPIVFVTACLLAVIDEMIEKACPTAPDSKGRLRWVFITKRMRPVAMGTLMGLVPFLPIVDGFQKDGYELIARIGTYVFAGILARGGGDLLIDLPKRFLLARGAAAAAAPPVPVPRGMPPAAGGTEDRP